VSDLSLPRTPVPARLLLTQGISRPGQIYVMERVPHHDGPETVLELLNRPEGFFAFRPAEDDEVLLVSKVQTVSLTVDRQAPIADPARLEQALAHLVQNAIDASPAGEPVVLRFARIGIAALNTVEIPSSNVNATP